MTELNFISKLQSIITRFKMWQAAFLLRKDYNNPSMQEFATLDSENFLNHK